MRLLQCTSEPWTNITISKERLSQGPEQGDLVDLNQQVIKIIDDEEQEQSESNNGDDNQSRHQVLQVEINNDGENSSPALLQNDVVLDETYEGVLNAGKCNTAQGLNADMTVTQINRTVQELRNSIIPVVED